MSIKHRAKPLSGGGVESKLNNEVKFVYKEGFSGRNWKYTNATGKDEILCVASHGDIYSLQCGNGSNVLFRADQIGQLNNYETVNRYTSLNIAYVPPLGTLSLKRDWLAYGDETGIIVAKIY